MHSGACCFGNSSEASTALFSRSDAGSDHVVRTAAGEVRKRLGQYYVNDAQRLRRPN
jgi:hypothetical protein